MRHFIFIVLSVFLTLSCRQSNHTVKKNNWTEQEIKQYFIDSIAMGNGNYKNPDSLNRFDFFMKTFYDNSKAKNYWDEFVYALDEPYIDTTKIDKDKRWIRLIVRPTFLNPYSITLDKIKNDTKVTFKMTNGRGGYYSGYLTLTSFLYFKDTLYNSYNLRLDKINFWEIKGKDSTCPELLDGTTFVFESIDKGKYNVVYRQSPSTCISKEAQELSKIGGDLFEISGANRFWKVNYDE